MAARAALVVLLLVSTAAFVVGVIVERSDESGHAEAAVAVAGHESRGSGESAEEHAAECAQAEPRHAEGGSAHSEDGERDTLAGVDVEAAPLVALAAGFTLALALAVWLRAPWGPLLAVVAIAMTLFAALDVREVFHQFDESRSGLALLAAVVAALHLTAAGVATLVSRREPASG